MEKLSSIIHMQLGVDMLNVSFYRPPADDKQRGDLVNVKSLAQEPGDFRLPLAQKLAFPCKLCGEKVVRRQLRDAFVQRVQGDQVRAESAQDCLIPAADMMDANPREKHRVKSTLSPPSPSWVHMGIPAERSIRSSPWMKYVVKPYRCSFGSFQSTW